MRLAFWTVTPSLKKGQHAKNACCTTTEDSSVVQNKRAIN